jgi:hypothetical protein
MALEASKQGAKWKNTYLVKDWHRIAAAYNGLVDEIDGQHYHDAQ